VCDEPKLKIMKVAIYISGILGMMLLVGGIIGTMLEFPLNNVILFLGMGLLLLVYLPLNLIDKVRYNRKIKKIIESYKGTKRRPNEFKKGDKKTKGWGMNDSPFRERKSGLTWGGGNIKGSNATRGTRKKFLQK